MKKKPVTTLREAVTRLAAIDNPTQRAQEAGEMTTVIRDEVIPEVARIRQEAIREMRAQKLSYREIGDLLGIHFTRVKQLETGESTGKWKRAATPQEAPDEPPASES